MYGSGINFSSIVRYFYKDIPPITCMRSRMDSRAHLVYLHRPVIVSSAIPADCCVCGRGVEDGTIVTARNLPGEGTRFFCSQHCP